MPKRKYAGQSGGSKKRRVTTTVTVVPKSRRRSRRFRKGYDRTGGYYGRFKYGQELKFLDTTLGGTVDTTAEIPATGGQINLIAQGDTESTRDGRECIIKSISFRANFTYIPAAAAQVASLVTIMLVQDKQANGAAAVATDVVQGELSNTFNNLANNKRFKVLYRKIISFMPMAGATTAYNNVIKHAEFYKKCHIPLSFSGTTGVITEIRSNNLFWLWSVNNAAGDDLVTAAGTTRVRFVG